MKPLQPTIPVQIFSDSSDPSVELISHLGIDLGTTHSMSALARNSKPEVVTDITKSIVSFSKFGEIVVGKSMTGEDWKSIPSVKRLMGKESGQRIEIFGKHYTPEQISAEILKHIKESSEYSAGRVFEKVVVTVPAYFNDAERNATRFSAQLAGFREIRLLSEPTAAAVAYNIDHSIQGNYAVFDLGGGTFDVSVLQMKMGVFKVLATGGDTELGGNDFDALLATKLSISIEEAKEIKHHLSENNSHQLITRDEFDELVLPLVHKCMRIAHNTLEDSEVPDYNLKGIVLVGGATRMPIILEAISSEFNCQVFLTDPDRIVAYGAAIRAEYIYEKKRDNMLLDVVPLSLGIESYSGVFERIINRNSTIPTQKSQVFTTFEDNQTGIAIHILQGEREFAKDCRSLGKLELRNLPPMEAGVPQAEVTFVVDEDGILSVRAKELRSGVEQSVELKPSYGLDRKAMSLMLVESMENAKSDMMGRLLTDAVTNAKSDIRSVKDAMKKYPELLSAEEKDKLEKLISGLEELIFQKSRSSLDDAILAFNGASQDFMERAVSHALVGLELEAVNRKK